MATPRFGAADFGEHEGVVSGPPRLRAARSIAFALLLACAVPSHAAATPIEYIYSGVVTSVRDLGGLLPGSVMLGTTFTGTFAYDDSVPNLGSSSSIARYDHPPHVGDFSLSLGPLSVSRAEASSMDWILVGVENNLSSRDGFLFSSFLDSLVLPGIPVDAAFIDFVLVDSSGQAFDSVALPAMLSLADFDLDSPGLDYNLDFSFWSGTDSVSVEGTFTSLVLVPEPGTGALVATGCLALAAARRRSAYPI